MNNLPSYHPTDCNAAATYMAQCCPRVENGGIRHAVLVEQNYAKQVLRPALAAAGEDYNANLAAWFNARQAGKAIPIANLRGSYAEPSPITSPGYGGAADITTGFDHEVVVHDQNLIGNLDFVNKIRTLRGWVLFFATSGVIWDTQYPFSGEGMTSVEEDNNSQVVAHLKFRWKGPNAPQHSVLPVDWFNCEAFDMTVLLASVTLGPPVGLNFVADFESPAPSAGTITLISVMQGTSDVTADYTLTGTPIAVATNDVSKALPVTKTLAQAPGTYVFTFELAGAGRDAPQLVQVTQIVP